MNDLLRIAFNVLDAYKSCFDTNNNRLDKPCFETAVRNLNVDKQILALASKQLQIMKNNFDSHVDLESAFSDFGQGVLYDVDHDDLRTSKDRNGNPTHDPKTGNIMIYRIHKMDDESMWGWWHAFIRGAVVVGADENEWFEIDKLVAFASEIDSIVRPKQSFEFPNAQIPKGDPQDPSGPGSPQAVSKAKPILLAKSFGELDRIFASNIELKLTGERIRNLSSGTTG